MWDVICPRFFWSRGSFAYIIVGEIQMLLVHFPLIVSDMTKAVKIIRRKLFNLKLYVVLSYLRLRNLTIEAVSHILIFWKGNKMKSDLSKNTSGK